MKRFITSRDPGLSDLLNYAHFVGDGIILNKDGAFLQSFQLRGPDIHSSTSDELDALANHFNQAIGYLEDGWMLHVDELRVPSMNYPKSGYFPNSVAALIDDERRQLFANEEIHYENQQIFTLIWKFPAPLIKNIRHWFIEGAEQTTHQISLTDYLKQFEKTIERCLSLLRSELSIVPLDSRRLLDFLNTCLSGELEFLLAPAQDCFLDVVLGRRTLTGGYFPKIGDKNICALTINGYLNSSTIPGFLDEMSAYPLIYRWSNRFIPLSQTTAEREMKRYQKNWHNKIKGFSGILKETISGKPAHKKNLDAETMSNEINLALASNTNRQVRFGYWTSVLIIIHEKIHLIDQACQNLSEYLRQNGFTCQREDVNCLDAWLGSIPGHGSCNARRLFIHSLNLAHILPLNSIWAGRAVSSKSSLLPPQSPPVFYAATTGKTPFRFHLDVGDIGHQIIFGPTGSGKSTYLDFLIAQFLRYKNARIFVFDKDCSHLALTVALEGYHYDFGHCNQPYFSPLADLSTANSQMRACLFVENLVSLQKINLTPSMRKAIHQAVLLLACPEQKSYRNLSVLAASIQEATVREALQFYTLAGPMKLLDAEFDHLQTSHLLTFEMNWLLAQTPDIYLPVLFYIFDQIELFLENCHSQCPVLIILEEAWLYISHPLFSGKIKDWLKTLRKKNARVIFATQSLSDLYDHTQSSVNATTAAIMESCPTKIFLPNPKLEESCQNLYKKIGLNQRQIEIITQISIPKRHYYMVSPEGNRLIELGFKESNSLALAFLGLSVDQGQQLLSIHKTYGPQWVAHWLKKLGLTDWADFWLENYYLKEKR